MNLAMDGQFRDIAIREIVMIIKWLAILASFAMPLDLDYQGFLL